MTSQVEHIGRKTVVHISCDGEGCGLEPSDETIIAGGGLTRMGWARVFDETDRKYKHYCPAHRETREGREL